jgi:hypothetical protein
MSKRRLGLWIAALTLGLTLVGAPALAAPPVAPSPEAPASAAPQATTDDSAPAKPSRQTSYAAREAASPHAADFKGNGVGIYIGGGTLAVVLLIVLIVVLL